MHCDQRFLIKSERKGVEDCCKSRYVVRLETMRKRQEAELEEAERKILRLSLR